MGGQGPLGPQVALPLGGKVILISYTNGVWEEGQGGVVAPPGPPLAPPLHIGIGEPIPLLKDSSGNVPWGMRR